MKLTDKIILNLIKLTQNTDYLRIRPDILNGIRPDVQISFSRLRCHFVTLFQTVWHLLMLPHLSNTNHWKVEATAKPGFEVNSEHLREKTIYLCVWEALRRILKW